VLTDNELYRRGVATLLATWEEIARGANGASVRRLPGVAAAVFPAGPERDVYNNAVLARDLPAPERAAVLDAMEAAYAAGGVDRFAAWVHDSDAAMRAELEARGYAFAEATRAMGMSLDAIRVPRPRLDLAPPSWPDYLRVLELPAGLLDGVDPAPFHVLIGRLEGRNVTTGMAFDHDGDCGIYNVGTLAHARRRGLGTALTALLVHDARERGCRTATLQSTEMAESVYAAVGFRDLGRFLEYAPSSSAPPRP
jgi:ribosomal protein S18 acetylase RimI-like enzyme